VCEQPEWREQDRQHQHRGDHERVDAALPAVEEDEAAHEQVERDEVGPARRRTDRRREQPGDA
jgi:hypothetical protein